jgi:hypothetical protein
MNMKTITNPKNKPQTECACCGRPTRKSWLVVDTYEGAPDVKTCGACEAALAQMCDEDVEYSYESAQDQGGLAELGYQMCADYLERRAAQAAELAASKQL